MRLIIILLVVFLFAGCQNSEKPAIPKTDYAAYVNPFIGTSKMGHTFPGATAPFGMVQVSPQTGFEVMHQSNGSYNPETYAYCAGYQYKDTTILGFAHTNFSGTGHSDLGDLLLMPTTGPRVMEPLKTEDGSKGFYSVFSHDREEASPGYYSVYLDSYDIQAELTASERTGLHKYTFNTTGDVNFILDMVYNVYQHENKNVWTFLRIENDSLITGYRQTKGWARTRKVFFALQFSKAFKNYGHKKYDKILYDGFYRRFQQEKNFPEMAGKNLRAWFEFEVEEGEEILCKMALSPVSTAGALKNMQAEVPHWDFARLRRQTRIQWNRELAKIEAEMMSEAEMTTFYTALYHASLTPILYEDIDGQYRGLDQNIHPSDGFTNYTIFSLWDTYRALHPLLNLLQPERNNDMIKSMLAHQEQSVHHMLPIWSHYANENWCMIGYHAVSLLADAQAKGVGDFDPERALNAAVQTATVPYFEGLDEYMEKGYVPDDRSHSSVSKTLEYAYNDWCIAEMAKALGEAETETVFRKRSENFRNVFNPHSGYMHPRLANGNFRADFDPLDTHGQGFIEGNAWNYGLYVPHQPEEMILMMGRPERMTAHLDSLFTMELDDRYIEKNEDITRDGMIGNYVHGNEPGHHIPYLYNWTGAPHKTQERVRMIMDSMYGPGVTGLCGNDDAGQMSAWYVFSALGFYPVLPGSPYYAVGSPLVKNATVHLANGKTLQVIAQNQARKNIYVAAITLNGKPVNPTRLNHLDLMQGGQLVFTLSDTPNLNSADPKQNGTNE